jgi:hypothetical protein
MTNTPIQTELPWKHRRRYVAVVLAFCMLTVAWALYKNLDTKVAETVVMMAFWCIIATTGSYVFGATWSDVSLLKK